MKQLMKIELKKWKLSSFLTSILITNLILLVFIIPPMYFNYVEGANNAPNVLQAIDSLSRFAYIIFSGTMAARIIVDEYHDKTMQLLFTYPVSRKKVLLSKLCIVIGITFTSLVFVRALLFFVAVLLGIVPVTSNPFLFEGVTPNYLISSVIYDLSSSMLCMISLFFGMRKKSSKQTIIASILVAILLIGNFGNLSLSATVFTPIMICALGLIFIHLSVRNLDTADFL